MITRQSQGFDLRAAGRPSGSSPRRRPQALLIDAEPSLVDSSRALVRAARAAGVPVALARPSDETDELDAEFDAVVRPGGPGTHRPARAYFDTACTALNVTPAQCLYVGADDRDVRGARAAGLLAYRWNGPDDVACLTYLAAALGLTPRS